VKLHRSGRAHRWLPGCLTLVVALSAVLGRTWAQADGHPEVTVAVLRDAAPFSYQAPDGTWKGLAVEMWDMVARQLHLEYYAFAMRPDEPLRRSINSAIAHILDSEQWNRLRFDYLGDEAEIR